jgi:hypothetical protein
MYQAAHYSLLSSVCSPRTQNEAVQMFAAFSHGAPLFSALAFHFLAVR